MYDGSLHIWDSKMRDQFENAYNVMLQGKIREYQYESIKTFHILGHLSERFGLFHLNIFMVCMRVHGHHLLDHTTDIMVILYEIYVAKTSSSSALEESIYRRKIFFC